MKKIILYLFIFVLIAGCGLDKKEEVVIYTSLDQLFSEPILKEFEQKYNIRVKAVYDVEAVKTTGLVNRLIAESNNPQADIFWNSEIGRTIILKNKGILEPYFSPSSADIPNQFKDREGFWTGFAARARVLVYNRDLLKDEGLPVSVFDLTDPQHRGKVALANPLFGTTAIHATSIFKLLGDEKAAEYFQELKNNDVVIVDGNSTSRDRIVDGIFKYGFTDTDDVFVSKLEGEPIEMIFPDQDTIGTLLIPNTVCLIKNGPNSGNGRRLIDYLLSERIESKLSFSSSRQIPLRAGVKRPKDCPDINKIKWMKVDYEDLALDMQRVAKILQEILF